MTPELLSKRCGRCKRWLLAGDVPYENRHGFATLFDELAEVAIFHNHTAANAAARAAGWTVQSESIGGDVCGACLEERDQPDGPESID